VGVLTEVQTDTNTMPFHTRDDVPTCKPPPLKKDVCKIALAVTSGILAFEVFTIIIVVCVKNRTRSKIAKAAMGQGKAPVVSLFRQAAEPVAPPPLHEPGPFVKQIRRKPVPPPGLSLGPGKGLCFS